MEQLEEAEERCKPSIFASTSALRIVDALKKKSAAPSTVTRCQIHASGQQKVGSGVFVVAPGPFEETQCLQMW